MSEPDREATKWGKEEEMIEGVKSAKEKILQFQTGEDEEVGSKDSWGVSKREQKTCDRTEKQENKDICANKSILIWLS